MKPIERRVTKLEGLGRNNWRAYAGVCLLALVVGSVRHQRLGMPCLNGERPTSKS